MQELLRDPEPNLDWETSRPVLDAAMHELSELDREAILPLLDGQLEGNAPHGGSH
jgi:hypothetical protein